MQRTLITIACLLVMMFGSVRQADARWFWRPKSKPKPVPAETYERAEFRFPDGSKFRYERYTRSPVSIMEKRSCGVKLGYGTGGELSAEGETVRAAACAVTVVTTVQVAACKLFSPRTWGECLKDVGRLLNVGEPTSGNPQGEAGWSSGRESRAKGVNLLQSAAFHHQYGGFSDPLHAGRRP